MKLHWRADPNILAFGPSLDLCDEGGVVGAHFIFLGNGDDGNHTAHSEDSVQEFAVLEEAQAWVEAQYMMRVSL